MSEWSALRTGLQGFAKLIKIAEEEASTEPIAPENSSRKFNPECAATTW